MVGLTMLTGSLLTGTASAEWPTGKTPFRIQLGANSELCVALKRPKGFAPTVDLAPCNPDAVDQRWEAIDDAGASRLQNGELRNTCLDVIQVDTDEPTVWGRSCKSTQARKTAAPKWTYQSIPGKPGTGTIGPDNPPGKFCWQKGQFNGTTNAATGEMKGGTWSVHLMPCKPGDAEQSWILIPL
ncbi:hypothetical protein [Nocardia sp. BMG51109]|uniref:hypothetical protein n=1 Tax=Nocardia sp. BMG51109 TaxID=1056816 RepID=UPI0004652D08|nr:hypothetical protein [Nocardia sp. BMG51109]